MNSQLLITNIIFWADKMKKKPTVLCSESGAGKDFISNIKKGQTPSVTKVQMLADYIGISTSELLGEKNAAHEGDGLTDRESALIAAYRKADDRAKQVVELTLAPWIPPAQSDEAM